MVVMYGFLGVSFFSHESPRGLASYALLPCMCRRMHRWKCRAAHQFLSGRMVVDGFWVRREEGRIDMVKNRYSRE